MYELAMQHIAEQRRAARRAGEARALAAAARGRRGKAASAEEVVTPTIPDFADEMFEVPADAVPERQARGRNASLGR